MPLLRASLTPSIPSIASRTLSRLLRPTSTVIIVNPLLTDSNDWYGGCFPSSAPFLEIGFLDGYQMPQIFIANLPTQGTQFTNDQLQIKAKFVFGGKPIDFRGTFKEVVP